MIPHKELLDAIGILVCQVNKAGFFIYLNRQWEFDLGYTLSELYAKPFIDFVHEEDKEKTLTTADSQRYFQTPFVSFRNRYIRKDSTIATLEWNSATQKNGYIAATAVVVRNSS